ncbi:acyl-CoA carboxylase subunit epsilon [Microbacterium oleivorans]|uniref:acyl-CoA carboxylase subunit epsilon n=1 Tax=Microbacterium TaxID=33882 RepID=UPI00203F6BA4|nr:acyl-CoA carboxylase subunit epsilon [Microbacterium oleivorans]MCM3697609.1 acyl-CoA carboxylase subunit epsilon [Microbacterium oleivorans]
MTEPDDIPADAPHVRLRRGSATPEELAAVIAVVSESLVHEASTAVADEPTVSAWRISARGVANDLRRDVPWGRWAG